MSMIYTIGHSNHELNYFLSLLKDYCITHLIDIRSLPYSRYVPQYNKDSIKKSLNDVNINYYYMGNSLGARRNDSNLYSENGIVDFDKVSKCSEFQNALQKIKNGLVGENKIAIMCSEKEPIDCHRSILVGYELFKQGIAVYHILSDGTIKSQEQMNKELLDLYFPNRFQISLIEKKDELYIESNYLMESFRLRNLDIGYRKSF